MAQPLQTFDLGRTLGQAQNIVNARSQNALMQEQLNPNSLNNQHKQAQINALNYKTQNPGSGGTANMQDIMFLQSMRESGKFSPKDIALMEDAISKRWYGNVAGSVGSAQGGQFTGMSTAQDEAAAKAYEAYMVDQAKLQSQAGTGIASAAEFSQGLGGGNKTPVSAADNTKAQKDVEYDVKLREQLPAAKMSFRSARDNMHNVKTIATKAKSLASEWNTGLMSMTNIAPGSKGYQLKQEVLSLQANAVLGAVAELKQAGGTLGQITEKELPLLESKWARLIASQSKADLVSNINQYLEQLERSVTRIGIAGRETYGEDWDLKIDEPTPIQGVTQDAVNWNDL